MKFSQFQKFCDRKNWADAKAECQNVGGYLAQPKDRESTIFLGVSVVIYSIIFSSWPITMLDVRTGMTTFAIDGFHTYAKFLSVEIYRQCEIKFVLEKNVFL
ncbi:hypothetical protein Y032_0212g2238 [Ancylostoma ceylanicum]|uniref:C-type lectin domain-containing protein n=1 Tax=Ancylostoma ceylanicum TaxID=53326 RepID=A0A016SKT4_9BILA|nr:hypothetical protein Y032_0212g2238 [Ancylostoma ceylanicum]